MLNYSTQLQVQFITQGRHTIAYSPALDISTSGKNTAEARKRFQEMAHIFIKEIVSAGTAEDVLKELGWTRRMGCKNWTPPAVFSLRVGIKVPVAV